jgi:hypothetical protein
VPADGPPSAVRAGVGVAWPGPGDVLLAAATGLADPLPAAAAAAFCPPAVVLPVLVPRAAQPAVNVTAVSAAAVRYARARQPRHLPFPRLPRPA